MGGTIGGLLAVLPIPRGRTLPEAAERPAMAAVPAAADRGA